MSVVSKVAQLEIRPAANAIQIDIAMKARHREDTGPESRESQRGSQKVSSGERALVDGDF